VNNDGVQAMGAMNKQMNLPALSNIMREFDRQNERMEMTSEMMGDAVDDAFEASHVFTAACLASHVFTAAFSMHSNSNSSVGIYTDKCAQLRPSTLVGICWLICLAHASGVVLSVVSKSFHNLHLHVLQYTFL